jgi:hypothetical protein
VASGLFSHYIRVTTGAVDVIQRFAHVLDGILNTLDRRGARAAGTQIEANS